MYSDEAAETLREFPSGEEADLGTLQTFRGYRVLESLPSSGAESDIHVIDCSGERRILKLYRLGIEPKLEVLQKVETLSRKHPEDLVRIHETGYDERSGRWYEIQEHVSFGTLKNLLEKSGALSEGARDAFFRDVLREISSCLAVLHDNGILHLDLKPGNVLVRSEFPLDLVLTDFGIASILDSELSKKFTKSRGTPMYQSPESITGTMGKASDWWGLGMIALEIASGAHPFRGLSQQVIQAALTTKPVEIPESVPEGCRELLCGLLTRDMKKRWGYDQVNRWLSGERGIPHYFERSVEDSGKRSGAV
ncbi:MAG: serine/threonine-protein kinase, partial [Synergistales bacterium]|nr:serine/threonine-protein kinase [Synergistales bacterium]